VLGGMQVQYINILNIMQHFVLLPETEYIYSDGIALDKDECQDLIEKLKKQMELDQEEIKMLKRYKSIEYSYSSFVHRCEKPREGEVYFAKLKNGLIKIGCSKDTLNRLKALKKEFGEIKLLKSIKVSNMYHFESLVHFVFDKYRKERELFDLSYIKNEKILEKLYNMLETNVDKKDYLLFMIQNDLDI
jgi:hypothetical protein